LITIAHSNSERLVRLINDILDIEKIEAGRMRFDVAPLEVNALVELAVQANRGFAEGHGVELVVEPIDSAARIIADPDRMMQVLTNLLSNAIKFSPPQEKVIVSVRRLDRRHRISVADRGAGIPDEFRARIFSKFAQADSTDTRQKGGTGLGLSIVKEIVTRMGGNVTFESTPGDGTIFHVDLPAADQRGEAGRIHAEALAASGEAKILHVEDDPDMLRLVSSAFEGRSQVFSTPSVEEARAALLRHGFDAVILDVGMSDGSGLELVPLIRRENPNAPIVIFTAQDTNEEVAAAVDAVLVKSRSSLDRLVAEVEQRAAKARVKGEGTQ
jgi:CheY-like chemotaxis protein